VPAKVKKRFISSPTKR